MNYETKMMSDIAENIAKKTELSILSQLSDFIKRGLIVVETTDPIMTMSHDYTLEIKRSVNLKLKDQEYIEVLEKENNELRARLKMGPKF